MTGLRYLQTRSPSRAEQDRLDPVYSMLRDLYVVQHRYHTARGYARDLDHLFDWATAQDKTVLTLTAEDIAGYATSLSPKYTSNTLIRIRTALRGFYDLGVRRGTIDSSPMDGWSWPGRT